MKPMKFVNTDILRATIDRLGTIFNSHELLQSIMAYYPNEYIRELHDKVDRTADPILQTNSDIASRLNYDPFNTLVENVGTTMSKNMRGNETSVHVWRRRAP